MLVISSVKRKNDKLIAENDSLKSEGGNPKRHKVSEKQIIAALHQAASEGNSDTFKKLLTETDNKNPRDTFGITPLHKAAGVIQKL